MLVTALPGWQGLQEGTAPRVGFFKGQSQSPGAARVHRVQLGAALAHLCLGTARHPNPRPLASDPRGQASH